MRDAIRKPHMNQEMLVHRHRVPYRLRHVVLAVTSAAILCVAANGQSQLPPEEDNQSHESSVGMSQKIEQIILPGSELEAVPVEDRQQPIVLRVVATFPHGSDFRYDLEYYGLDPGEYNLADYLRRIDGSSTDDLPAISVTIKPLLEPGQVLPHALEAKQLPWLGGYRLLLVLGGLLWFGVLMALIFWRKKTPIADHTTLARQATVADRLRAFAHEAKEGRLTADRHAELEHLLLAHWRKKLNVAHLSPGKAIAALREDDEAGELLRTLERWLHAPNVSGKPTDDIDIEALLRPYENKPVASV